MKRFRVLSASILVLCFGASLMAQTPAKLAFEVASIKPSPPLSTLVAEAQSGKINTGIRIDGARLDLRFASLSNLLSMAYKLKPHQIVGPDWMPSQLFEIHATLPPGSTKEQIPDMMQTLLEERFKLTYHKETREQQIYALIVGKDGPKMKEAVEEPAAPANQENPSKTPGSTEPKGKELSVTTATGEMKIKQEGRGMVMDAGAAGRMRMTMGENNAMRMEISKMKMSEFAELLSQFVERPVMDMTELKPAYQVELELPLQELMNLARKMMPELAGLTGGAATPGAAAPATGLAGIAPSDPGGGTMFDAVQRLGLKLDPRKAPTDTLIIDHIEKTPTEN